MFIDDLSAAIPIVGLILVIIIGIIFIFKLKKMVFLFSPSFYAIIAGALIGAWINLLTGLVFSPRDQNIIKILFMAVCIFMSSITIIYISFDLEKLNRRVSTEVSEKENSIRLDELIPEQNRIIYLLAISWIFLIIGMFQIYYIL
ncbi:MAG TPA: hypothetical protein VKL21_05715 [Candidatus Methanoperedens sp.]|nr:hypothetical protein [Candidatus Methanoperedens sp.]